jgi:hypothetical protein
MFRPRALRLLSYIARVEFVSQGSQKGPVRSLRTTFATSIFDILTRRKVKDGLFFNFQDDFFFGSISFSPSVSGAGKVVVIFFQEALSVPQYTIIVLKSEINKV